MPQKRETFEATDLAMALSHYDLGIITAVRDFPRGSSRSPKLVLDSERGRFLFKRRAHGKDDIHKVAFTHQVQLHLAAQSFPLPHLMGSRPDNNSMLVLGEHIYEMFEYIEGVPYTGSLEATYDAGRILGLYHKLLTDFRTEFTPPRASYHNARAIAEAVGNTAGSLPIDGRPAPDVLVKTVKFLESAYRQCAESANQAGLKDWPLQIVHGDWHPGNMLFRDKVVVAVIDYDSARLQQRAIDLANGALQFSITGGAEDPSKWPDYPDQTRLRRFVQGYDSVNVISRAELGVLGPLMCEAMIAEAVLPIAATGSFGRMEGFPFLQMIERKVKWVFAHRGEIENILKE